ncbi:MAG: diphosphate--fructose-6-phosphate 1-phosphotransferase [Brevinematales bacterium]|nr:diphosphate--fructose-6-phosphate 1-phosphotransferase [Brevinematales bacterium]
MLENLLISMENHNSLFENEIRKLNVPVCDIFVKDGKIVPAKFEKTDKKIGTSDVAEVNKEFPKTVKETENKILKGISGSVNVSGKRVAVLFSGGPAAGGHNVIIGLKKVLGDGNILFGVKNGPKGLLEGTLFEIKEEDVKRILNTGGFDFLGSDRTKIKSEEQYEAVRKTVKDYQLNGIVVVGGDDSNTNAAVLAELLYDMGVQVIGVPKTIDGDLQIGDILPISFGFDTATKIYSELVGNILQDTPSSRKYWHFIKLMGRSASHVALEVALQTRPAIALISEEVEAKKMSLGDIVKSICDVILTRASKGINHGVIVIPEGLIEFVPEMKSLIAELNDIMGHYGEDISKMFTFEEKKDFIYKKLNADSAKLMASLPDEFEKMLLLDRDAHGNLQVSQIPTEKLLITMVEERINEVKNHLDEIAYLNFDEKGLERIKKFKFATNNHFFGYEGRCGAPSLFDAAYTLNLGLCAGSLILDGKTGYIASVTDFDKGGSVLALPLTGLLNIEKRHGKNEMVIKKGLVEVDSPAFKFFEKRRKDWAEKDLFTSPGPRQLWGPVSKQLPITVALNRGYSSLEFNLGKETKVF